MAVLEQRVNPMPVVQRWARGFTAYRPTAHSEIRVAERACSLWAILAAAPGVLVLEDVLVGSFRLLVSTGAAEPTASIFNTPHGVGVSVVALLEALRWRYPGETCGCRCWRLHWSEGADEYLLRSLLAPLWDGGRFRLAREGLTYRARIRNRIGSWSWWWDLLRMSYPLSLGMWWG